MENATETALHALASATTAQDAECGAAQCDEAAALLRQLAQRAPRPPRALTINYTGDPVRLDPTKIDPHKHVVPDNIEEDCGEQAARLFMDALEAGAIVAPDGIKLECYGDDDTIGGGIVLVAFSPGGHRRGVTCGWREVRNIFGDSPEDALEFMVAELNTALGVPPPRPKRARVSIAAKRPLVRAGLCQIVDRDARSIIAGELKPDDATLREEDLDLLIVEVGSRRSTYTVEDLEVFAKTFPHTPILVISAAGAPTSRIRPLADVGVLAEKDISSAAIRNAIAKAARRDRTPAGDGATLAGEQ
jgi:hypothetical protein